MTESGIQSTCTVVVIFLFYNPGKPNQNPLEANKLLKMLDTVPYGYLRYSTYSSLYCTGTDCDGKDGICSLAARQRKKYTSL